MNRGLRTSIMLPGSVLVFIPAAISWVTNGTPCAALWLVRARET